MVLIEQGLAMAIHGLVVAAGMMNKLVQQFDILDALCRVQAHFRQRMAAGDVQTKFIVADLGDRGRIGCADGLAETLLDVPLIIRAPLHCEAGPRDDAAMLLDLAPTILSVAGLPLFEIESNVSARSLLAPPAIGARPRDLVALRLEDGRPTWRSIRRGSMRLTISNRDRWRLHDMDADPGQRYNVFVHKLAEAKNLGARLDRYVPAGSDNERTD